MPCPQPARIRGPAHARAVPGPVYAGPAAGAGGGGRVPGRAVGDRGRLVPEAVRRAGRYGPYARRGDPGVRRLAGLRRGPRGAGGLAGRAGLDNRGRAEGVVRRGGGLAARRAGAAAGSKPPGPAGGHGAGSGEPAAVGHAVRAAERRSAGGAGLTADRAAGRANRRRRKKLAPFERKTGWKCSVIATNIRHMWGISGSHQPRRLDARPATTPWWSLGHDLDCWVRLLALHDQDDLERAAPDTTRYRLYTCPPDSRPAPGAAACGPTIRKESNPGPVEPGVPATSSSRQHPGARRQVSYKGAISVPRQAIRAVGTRRESPVGHPPRRAAVDTPKGVVSDRK